MQRLVLVRLTFAALPLSLALVLSRCGAEKDKDTGTPQPAGNGVPGDWDGLEDYAGSTVRTVDE